MSNFSFKKARDGGEVLACVNVCVCMQYEAAWRTQVPVYSSPQITEVLKISLIISISKITSFEHSKSLVCACVCFFLLIYKAYLDNQGVEK